MAQQFSDVRPSPIAGRWYPGDARRLASSIDEWLADAPEVDVAGRVLALVVPHAGHPFSGPVAARAFRAVQGRSCDRVVILSPYHNLHPGGIITTGHAAYQTPLGSVPVDTSFVADLKERLDLTVVRRDPEHAVEIEIPFLQRALAGDWSLVPLMLRDQRLVMAESLGAALADLADARTLLVASSDLSHFYPDQEARKLDRLMLDQVEALDPAGVIRVEEEGKAFACGRAAIATVLVAAKQLGASQAQIVGYATSGDTTGDRQRVVGYGAAVVS
jgi:AmmeMemoRadiSam system protein B